MPTVSAPHISVVINTLNRAEILGKVLRSFLWQQYPGEFELIVVNGPSTDQTEAVLAEWAGKIRVGHCSDANLSMSRNVGINMALGEWVVFIDDDAFPEPEWLSHLMQNVDGDEVAAVTGLIYNHTGREIEYRHIVLNRFCEADYKSTHNSESRCFPKSFQITSVKGGNTAFRKSMLVSIGGFDEEIEYYAEETDVCFRLIDAGFVIRSIEGAYVHHKCAPSNVRDNSRILKRWYPILKNRVYFSLKQGHDFATESEIMARCSKFYQEHREAVNWHIKNGRLTSSDLARFESEALLAQEVGLARGRERIWKHMRQICCTDNFLPFRTLHSVDSLSIVLVSQYYLPEHDGGIPTFTRDLAESLSSLGHIVHVIAQSPDIDRVDFENGVWVHRLLSRESVRSDEAIRAAIPERIWNWSATALDEVRRISRFRTVDVVEAPIWDCQGAAFLFDGTWPLITSLHTTLRFWMDSNPMYANDSGWMRDFGSPMLALEQRLMESSVAVRANSAAIMTAIESVYPMKFDLARTRIIPHGMPHANFSEKSDSSPPAGEVIVLFVGRLEKRKGIDTLLLAIPLVLAECPEARFRILGDDTLPADNGKPYKKTFFASPDAALCGNRIQFGGRVSQEVLDSAYRECDIFVAPSRFESFGLVFLEAMREAKPVVGCRAGGMPEVISDEDNGLLVEPEDFRGLARVLIRLVKSCELRKTMGNRGRARFEEKFTSRRMAQESIPLYQLAMKNHKGVVG